MRVTGIILLVAAAAAACAPAPALGTLGDHTKEDADSDGRERRPKKGGAVDDGKASTAKASTPLVAFTGGADIALRWSVIGQDAKGVREYLVYRDGTQIATVTPGFHPDFPEKDGKGYIDSDITAGATYEYRVQAVDTKGAASDVGGSLEVAAPRELAALPTVDFDTSQAPDLEDFAQSAKPFLENWYAKVAFALALPDVKPAWSFTVFFDASYDGIAEEDDGGPRIRVNPQWVREHRNESYGMLLHESVHTLQQTDRMNGWVREGIADWSREYMLHDRDPKPIGTDDDYRDGYSQGSFFINWAQETYGAPLVRALTTAGHQRAYSSNLFFDQTGKSVGELWEQLTGRKQPTGALRLQGMNGKCVDGGGVAGTGHAQVAPCKSVPSQRWFWGPQKPNADDGTIFIEGAGGCLDVAGGSKDKGARVQTWGCGKGAAGQSWQLQQDGSLLHPASGLCLDAGGGADLRLWDCNGSSGQAFALPQ